ncbi:hypothetical protein K438DRAFT_837296 [Mycena galopus ATCC 62051]|nr:hypothetical protein K438DRAFT_837296 [Mycena galopus ATCC 62051]
MALPPHFTIFDLTGRFVINHALSDSYEHILKEQGIDDPELRREVSCDVLTFNHYKDENGSERIWVQQDLDGCPQIADDHRILDWLDHAKNDTLFGPVIERTRRIGTHTLQPPFLRKGWTPDTLKYGVLEYQVRSDIGENESWMAIETWGIESAEEKRRFARHVMLTGPGAWRWSGIWCTTISVRFRIQMK